MNNTEQNTKRESTLILMIQDYLKYGYTLKFLLEQNYPIIKAYGENNLKNLWAEQVQKLSQIF